MPKGVRTATNDFESKTFGPKDVLEFPAAPENGTINTVVSKKATVGTGVDPENILRWDREGVVLLFEQTDKFLPLSDGVLSAMGRDNRLRYSMAKEFHDAWRGDEHAKLVEDFKVDRNMTGSARDKMTIEGPKGMHIRWCAPYNIEKYRAMGYKVLSADEASSYLGPKDGHHEIGKLGQTELVAMGIPEERYKAMVKKTTAETDRRAGAWKTAGLADVSKSGAAGFVATDDDRRRWREEAQGPGSDEV